MDLHAPGSRAIAEPRQLLFVLNDCAFFVSHRLPIALAAQQMGYRVAVCTPPGPATRQLSALGIRHLSFTLDRQSTNPLTEMRAIAELVRVYREVRPDIVHHVSVKPVLYGSIAARIVGVPAVVNALAGLGYVFNNHGPKSWVLRSIVTRALRAGLSHPNVITIFQNPDDRALFLDHEIVHEARTVLIRGSGVDLAHFAALPEPSGVPLVVLASRMLWNKGVGEFVGAAENVRSSGNRDARFALVGDTDPGNPGAVPASQLEAWSRAGLVEWWGKRSDMPAVFGAAHIVALPSYYGEGVPKVLLEAAACGRPIVTTDEAGCREVVRHDHNGLLVPARNISALADALRTLLEDKEKRRSMGARGRERALAEFDVENVVRSTLNVYDQVLAVGPSRG